MAQKTGESMTHKKQSASEPKRILRADSLKDRTLCVNCANVLLSTRSMQAGRWLCSAYPRVEEINYVDPDQWVYDEPFYRCKNMNREGNCERYEAMPDD